MAKKPFHKRMRWLIKKNKPFIAFIFFIFIMISMLVGLKYIAE